MSSNLKVNTILPSTGTAIGIGTASGNVDVLGHIVGHNTPNISGINSVTATTFYGSGANLTGISAGTSLSGSTNNTVCTVTGANAIQGESNFTWTGSALQLTAGTGNQFPFNFRNDFTPNSQRSDLLYAFNGTSNNVLRIGSINSNGGITLQSTRASDSSVKHKLLLNPDGGDIGLGESNPNRSGYSSPVTSVGYNSSNGYGVLELLGNQTSDNTIANIVAYNVGGSSRLAAIAFERSGANNSGAIRFETYASGSAGVRARILSNGNFGIGNRTSSPDQLLHVHTASGDSVIHVEAAADPKLRLRAHSGESIVQFADASSSNVGEINYVHSGDYLKFRVNASDRMLIDSGGHLQLQHGLTALSGGGVIVCAAKSSSGTANQSNYKVDFVVPMGDLGTKKEYEDIRAQFSSGQTGKDWSHALGGSGILIATVQNNYYWGFRTKIYHITTYGNSSNNVTQLNLLHNYSAAGHGANSAAVDLAVQSHDGKTPKLRATFSGDYWNSNVLTVTYIGSAVASTGNIRQTTTFDSKLTGQDPTWK